MLIIVPAIFGLMVIAGGIWTLLYTKRASKKWRLLRIFALLLGLVAAAANLLYFQVTYPCFGGRMVGFPFVLAYFDARNVDFINDFLPLCVIGNALFWGMIPHFILAYCVWRHDRAIEKGT